LTNDYKWNRYIYILVRTRKEQFCWSI